MFPRGAVIAARAPVVADRHAAGIVPRPPLHRLRRRQRLQPPPPPAGAPPGAAAPPAPTPATASPPPASRPAPPRCAGATGAAAPPAAPAPRRSAPVASVHIGEARLHRREVQLRPPRARVGLDPAVRHREPLARPASAAPRAARSRPSAPRRSAGTRPRASQTPSSPLPVPIRFSVVKSSPPSGVNAPCPKKCRPSGECSRATSRPSAQSMTSANVPGRRAKATASGRSGCAAAACPRSGSGSRKHSSPAAVSPIRQ